MRAISDHSSVPETSFILKFINRPVLVLKCEFGLVGYRNKQCFKLECNKSTFHLFTLEDAGDGIYYLKGSQNGLYWCLSSDLSVSVTGREPSKFSIELCKQNRILVKAPNGQYLRAEQNGNITATCNNSQQGTQWEF